MFRTQSMGRENCSKEAGGYKQVCNKRSRQSEHQRSGIKLRKFSILCMGRRKLLGSLNSSLLCAPQLSGANPVSFFTLLLAFPQLLSNHRRGRQHLLDRSFGSPHSHLDARNCWWLWHFLFINMAGDIFISHSSVPTLSRLDFSPFPQGVNILVGEKEACVSVTVTEGIAIE